jgi:aryl-alcohol dehydrogenase-like predicted oxidoreductase
MNLHTVLPVALSRVGFGAYQIGRAVVEKYASHGEPMPSESEAEHLLNGVLDLGITLIDTAPAYGSSEERIGRYLHARRNEYNLCTKVGELTVGGKSRFDFTKQGMRDSVENSLRMLKTECVDSLLIHAPPDDLSILHESDALEMMHTFKDEGKTRAIGFSGKTMEAQTEALAWSDVMMIEYSAANESNANIIEKANENGVVVLLKKVMNSGHLNGIDAITFLTKKSPIRNMLQCSVIGSSSVDRMKENVETFKA